MLRIFSASLASLTFLLAGCGADGPRSGGTSTAAHEPTASSEPSGGQLYAVNALVLEDKTHGPMLCLGGVLLESLPPQCGNVPIAGWDWRAVEGEERVGGTIWGRFGLVGWYEGGTFAIADVGAPDKDASSFESDRGFASPCPEPEDGWTGLEHATQEDARPAIAYATSQPDHVTSWVTHLEHAKLEFGPVIVNAVFTGDRERHEAGIRNVWGGPLCVVERNAPSARDLGRIRKEVEASLDQLGLRMLWSSGPGVEPTVQFGVVVDVQGKAQAALDDRYGPGVVRLIPALRPIS